MNLNYTTTSRTNIIYLKLIPSQYLNSHFNICRITSKSKLSNPEFFSFQNNPFSTSITLSRHATPKSNLIAPKKYNVLNNLSDALHKTLLGQKEQQTIKRKGHLLLFEEALGLKLKWSK